MVPIGDQLGDDKMKINNTNLSMIRGDSESIILSIDENDNEYIFENGDKVYFTVKRNANTKEIIIQEVVTNFPDNLAIIEIEPSDTSDLQFRSYVYDIQLTTKHGRVKTVVPHSKFDILQEVTYE